MVIEVPAKQEARVSKERVSKAGCQIKKNTLKVICEKVVAVGCAVIGYVNVLARGNDCFNAKNFKLRAHC